jgi:hypothetical protein
MKYQLVEVLLKSYFVSSNYHHHMKSQECIGLKEELKFYRSCYNIQKSYVDSVLTLFKDKYEEFLKDLRHQLADPLKYLIKKFWRMKDESNENNLKDFLADFKKCIKKFETIIGVMDEEIPQNDTITLTFNEIVTKLDNEVNKLNITCKSNLDTLKLNSVDLNELSLESDQLLNDIINGSPRSASPINKSRPNSPKDFVF